MTDPPTGILITMATRPDPARYAAVVLAIYGLLELAGLAETSAVWPDDELVTDDEIGALHDRRVSANPWSR